MPTTATATADEAPDDHIARELQELADTTAKAASRPVQSLIRVVLAAVLVASGGGGVWLYSTDEQIRAAASHEAGQDAKIEANTKAAQDNARAAEANGQSIRRIAVLLVQQGRYVEDMVRDVAAGHPIRERPRELDTIERQILSSSGD